MKKKKIELSDIFMLFGLLLLSGGVYVEYGIGFSLITSGTLLLLLGIKLVPSKG